MRWSILALILALSGCVTPYTAYRHIDVSPLEGNNDAWDLACVGIKKKDRLSLKAGVCKNLRGGDMFEASVEYDFINR